VAFAAGLRIVKGAKSVIEALGFVEFGLIRGVRGIVHETIRFVIEAGGRLGKGRRKCNEDETKTQKTDLAKGFHGLLAGWSTEFTLNLCGIQVKKTKNSPWIETAGEDPSLKQRGFEQTGAARAGGRR